MDLRLLGESSRVATVYDAAGHACSSSDDQVITDQASLSFILLTTWVAPHALRQHATVIPLILSLSLSLSLELVRGPKLRLLAEDTHHPLLDLRGIPPSDPVVQVGCRVLQLDY